ESRQAHHCDQKVTVSDDATPKATHPWSHTMGRMKDYLMDLQRELERPSRPQEPCPCCGKPTRAGYCYYCGSGKRPPATSAEQRSANIGRALDLWDEALPIAGTLAEYYLRHFRCITILPPDVNAVIRFHPQCPFDKSYVPALVALLRMP